MKKLLGSHQIIRHISSSVLLLMATFIFAFAFWTTNPVNAKDKDPTPAAAPDFEGASDPNKCTVCHAPPGNPQNARTLTIGCSAVQAHLRNHPGDCLGPCPCQPTPKQNP